MDFSLSISSQTKRWANGSSVGSVNTKARIDRHVWHQSAHTSTNNGTLRACAWARADGKSSSMKGTTGAAADSTVAANAGSARADSRRARAILRIIS
jgi:hypothetical protein